MAQHRCAVPHCKKLVSGRNIFCSVCWHKIPAQHQSGIREGTEKGEHSLRAHPTKEWIQKAIKYCGSAEKIQGANVSVIESVTAVA